MAQPQGLNVPAIITTGIVTTLLVAVVIEGVRGYYNYTVRAEVSRKAEMGMKPLARVVRDAQLTEMQRGPLTIDAAMQQIVANGGKLPATQPAK